VPFLPPTPTPTPGFPEQNPAFTTYFQGEVTTTMALLLFFIILLYRFFAKKGLLAENMFIDALSFTGFASTLASFAMTIANVYILGNIYSIINITALFILGLISLFVWKERGIILETATVRALRNYQGLNSGATGTAISIGGLEPKSD